jgi:hypothetical protein
MTYTSSKFELLEGIVRFALAIRKDCKSSGELIHCYSHNEPPLGYDFKGLSTIGASLYALLEMTQSPMTTNQIE